MRFARVLVVEVTVGREKFFGGGAKFYSPGRLTAGEPERVDGNEGVSAGTCGMRERRHSRPPTFAAPTFPADIPGAERSCLIELASAA
jgi:hypothetical protein